MKKIIVLILLVLLPIVSAASAQSIATTPIIVRINGEDLGEFGKTVILDEGTENEMKYIGYFLPAGKYNVTNNRQYRSGIYVYSQETILDDGVEYPAEVGGAYTFLAGETVEIEVPDGFYIKAIPPSDFTITQSGNSEIVLTPTVLSPTATPKQTIPDFCYDLQMPLIITAEKLDAEGHPSPAKWDEENKICYYTISDPDSFLLIEEFGMLSFGFSKTEEKNMAFVGIDYKDNEQTKELYKDWSITVISNILNIDVISAQEVFVNTINNSVGFYDNYVMLAELNREQMQYQFTIMDLNLISLSN